VRVEFKVSENTLDGTVTVDDLGITVGATGK